MIMSRFMPMEGKCKNGRNNTIEFLDNLIIDLKMANHNLFM